MSSPHTHFLSLSPRKEHFSMSFHLSASFLILCGLVFSLSACSDEEASPFAPACPALEIPDYTADYVRYNASTPDLKHLMTHTQILGIHGDCRALNEGSHHTTRVRISLNLLQQYGPAFSNNEDHITLPYFIAVIKNGTIIDKKIFSTEIAAEPSHIAQKTATTLRFIDIPTGDNPQESPYTLEVGFQLSHDALSYNRHHLKIAHFKDYTPNGIEAKDDDE